MSDNRSCRQRGFTLVELLVVIGIIGILMSILIPVLGKVRRKAIVLACPIVYHSWNDNALRLIDPYGNYDYPLTKSYGEYGNLRPENPIWSPSGRKIGFNVVTYNNASGRGLFVLDPMTGALKRHFVTNAQVNSQFKGWYDENHIIEWSGSYYIRDAETGQTVQVLEGAYLGTGPLYLCPAGRLPGKWVTAYNNSVRYVRADLSMGKPIYDGPYPDGMHLDATDYPIDVDPMGEWVGWTITDGNHGITAIKSTAAPAWMPPSYLDIRLPDSGGSSRFCQWTDDGNMLVTLGDGMAIVKKTGEEVRRFKLDNHPDSGGWASWRRYGHQ